MFECLAFVTAASAYATNDIGFISLLGIYITASVISVFFEPEEKIS
jgi:hypothetical protein